MPRDPMQTLIRRIAREIEASGGRAYHVGGCVRDALLGRGDADPLDYDVEVYGLPLADLEALLRRHGRTEAVGRSFGILKFAVPAGEADFSLPRRESRTGRGHRGFLVDLDPAIEPAEACARRDFTVNAMLMDVLSGEVLDFHGGRADLAARVLRHTSPAFDEDPLRVYRLMQLAGRLEFAAAPETLELCRGIDLGPLAPERVFAEFEKLLLQAARPGLGLAVAREAGVLEYHPELKAMVGCPQDPEWHPEGDVWDHTLMVVDQAARMRSGDRRHDLALMFAALCHDLGKPATTRRRQGRIVSPNHSEEGLAPTRRFMERLTRDHDLVERVVELVRLHLRPAEFHRARHRIRNGTIRRLALETNIEELVEVARADHLGRTTPDAVAGDFPAGDWLLARAAELSVANEPPRPILMGRHLLERGWQPGPALGEALEEAYAAQLEGAFADLDGALDWLADWEEGADGKPAAPEPGAAGPANGRED
ncbi:MAG: HD domain-containing protein [Candidatus Krumholzibacteriota bacterium]|nr:HD domain-containing protein [Candidatus Krumholzibacteriota bacterium]